MMKHLFYLALLILTSSCQFFETEKISSDTFYQEEIKAIDWEDVDQYPVFPECETLSEKLEIKKCFEQTLQGYVSRFLSSKQMSTHEDLNDTVVLDFNIDKTGQISHLTITMDSLLHRQIPTLKQRLEESIDSLPKLVPAYKRGIPVKTRFTFPVVIMSEKSTN